MQTSAARKLSDRHCRPQSSRHARVQSPLGGRPGSRRWLMSAHGRVRVYPSVCCTADQFDGQLSGDAIESAEDGHRPRRDIRWPDIVAAKLPVAITPRRPVKAFGACGSLAHWPERTSLKVCERGGARSTAKELTRASPWLCGGRARSRVVALVDWAVRHGSRDRQGDKNDD